MKWFAIISSVKSFLKHIFFGMMQPILSRATTSFFPVVNSYSGIWFKRNLSQRVIIGRSYYMTKQFSFTIQI